MADLSPRSQTVVDQVKVLAGLLKSGLAICAVLIVLKVTVGGNKIRFPWGLELSTDHAWALLTIFTVVHLVLAVFLIRQTGLVQRESDLLAEGPDIVTKAISEGGYFLAGLDRNMRQVSERIVLRSKWDQSFWIACAGTVTLVAAVIPWHVGSGTLRWGSGLALGLMIPLAVVLGVLNWLAGGSWLVALARLAGTVSPPVKGAPARACDVVTDSEEAGDR